MQPWLLHLAILTGSVAPGEHRDTLPHLIAGVVVSRGAPVPGVNVFIRETLEGAISDTLGRFRFTTAHTGAATIVALRIGFRSVERPVHTADATARAVTIELEAQPGRLAPVSAVAGRFAAGEERGATLTALDVVATAGTIADVARAIQTLPGTQAVDEGTALFVRGGDQTETTVLLDDAVLHTAFSYESPNGTFIGTVDPFLLDGIVFAAGGFGARYGNALSGIAALRTMGRPYTTSFTAGAGLAALSASAAAPLRHGLALRATANQTDTDLLFRVNGSTQPYDPAPRGYDRSGSAIWNYSGAGELKLFGIAQRTRLGTGIEEASYSGTYHLGIDASVGVANWKDRFGRWSPSARLSRTMMTRTQDYGVFRLLTRTRHRAGGAQVDVAAAEHVTLRGGTEWEDLESTLAGSVPDHGYDRAPGARATLVGSTRAGTRIGAFAEADFIAGRRTRVVAGVRRDRSTLTDATTVDPRLSAAVTVVSGVVLTAAWGVYHQVPDPIFLDATLGDPTLPPMRATHAIGGVQIGSEGTLLRVEAYDKIYRDVVQMTRDFDVVGRGAGRARGVDVFAAGRGTPGMRWRVSFSALSSTRTDPHTLANARAPYDVPRTVTAVIQQVLPGSLHLGVTHRYASGRPITPVTGATFDASENVWVPSYGAPMSERLPAFRRVDVGLTHLRRVGPTQAVFYGGVQNVFDRQNLFAYRYNADYSERTPIRSLFKRSVYVGGSFTWEHAR